MSRRYCTCEERYGIVPEYHSCEYVTARNKLIPDAEAQAKAISRLDNGRLDFLKFNYTFSNLMEKAAREAGLYDL